MLADDASAASMHRGSGALGERPQTPSYDRAAAELTMRRDRRHPLRDRVIPSAVGIGQLVEEQAPTDG